MESFSVNVMEIILRSGYGVFCRWDPTYLIVHVTGREDIYVYIYYMTQRNSVAFPRSNVASILVTLTIGFIELSMNASWKNWSPNPGFDDQLRMNGIQDKNNRRL